VSPQLEAVMIAAGCTVTICACTLTWATIRADRTRLTWTAAVNQVAARVTEEGNERRALEDRVVVLEDRVRSQWGTGPRLGVAPIRRRSQ